MQRSSPRPAGYSTEESLALCGVLVVGLGIVGWFLWLRYHGFIAACVMTLQHWQMVRIGWFTDRYAGLDRQVIAAVPETVSFGALWRLMENVGLFFRWPAASAVGLLASLCWGRAAPGRFTRAIDLPRLMAIQARAFPVTAAFIGRGLKLTAIRDGDPRPCDPALHAPEWIGRYALGTDGRFDGALAEHALARQLGPRWKGVAEASPPVRCLFAAFALHAARRRLDALVLLGELSRSLPIDRRDGPGGPEKPLAFNAAAVAEADRVLGDADLVAPCKAVADRHAFASPALMSVLMLARSQAGVLAPAQFAFLKLVDRPLWYALHALGFPGGQNPAEQPNPRIEAAGARDHWAAECDVGGPMPAPSVQRSLAVVRSKAREHGLDKPAHPEPPP